MNTGKENLGDFDKLEDRSGFFVKELFMFLRYNKKFWLLPIIIVLLLLSALIILSGSSAAPFIYTLF